MDVLDIFYKSIIKEASIGIIDTWITYNIIFSTKILEDNYEVIANNDELYIPTLVIKDKAKFEKLLKEYVYRAREFYLDSEFDEEILNYSQFNSNEKIGKEKTLLAYLFANATNSDFMNINQYLERRIDFINNDYRGVYDLGYSSILNANLEVSIEKDCFYNETPYKFVLRATKDDFVYTFPSIKFGISDNSLYIYAIQNDKQDNNEFTKKINRILYKVGESFDSNNDNSNIFSSGNLKDITPSFLVGANVIVNFFRNYLGISNIIIPSILIERYNAKRRAILRKNSKYKLSAEEFEELNDEQIRIQTNLTEKFLRTFLRLAHHYSNINVFAYPDEGDNNLYLKQTDDVNCNNNLLLETCNLTNNIVSKDRLRL